MPLCWICSFLIILGQETHWQPCVLATWALHTQSSLQPRLSHTHSSPRTCALDSKLPARAYSAGLAVSAKPTHIQTKHSIITPSTVSVIKRHLEGFRGLFLAKTQKTDHPLKRKKGWRLLTRWPGFQSFHHSSFLVMTILSITPLYHDYFYSTDYFQMKSKYSPTGR